ncbi:MAG: hypothetical protein M1469_10170 [Bacteroidetes bacterium]|nr:hypothetical protein [Bacteroidota bacterium]MCL5268453.1 hypothetical protein [Bacteroidota bacterium]
MKDNGGFIGVFRRAFPVQLPEEPIRFMTAEVKNVVNIDDLKYQKWLSKSESSVFTLGEQAFGYGTGMEKFADDGFSETQVVLKDSPRLAEGLMIEALVDDARTTGRHYFGIYRNCCKMIRDDDYIVRGNFMVRIGYDLRALHWDFAGDVFFGLIIEPAWIIQRADAASKSSGISIRNVEEDLLRIHGVGSADEYVMSFVESHPAFLLPCGGVARLGNRPVTIFTETVE